MSLQKQKIGKDRFLQTAEKLFTERGYQAVSIRDIANQIGVTNAAIYYHFSSKEDLFDEVIIQHIKKFRRQMNEAAEQQADVKDKLVAMLMVYSSIASHKHSLFTLLHMKKHSESQLKHPDRSKEMMRAFFEPIEDVINSAVDEDILKELPPNILGSAVLIGMIHGTMQQVRQFQQKELDPQVVANLVDIFWNGMENRS